jgi:hypothetical protein
VLHVRRGDPDVDGWGEWAVRPDGIVTGHAVYEGRLLCDLCGRAAYMVPPAAERYATASRGQCRREDRALTDAGRVGRPRGADLAGPRPLG